MIKKICLVLMLFSTVVFASDRKHVETMEDQCDEIVLNYYFENKQKLIFTQFLFYEWRSDVIIGKEIKILKAWRLARRTRALTSKEFDCWEKHVKNLNLRPDVELRILQRDLQAVDDYGIMNPQYDVQSKKYIMIWYDGDVLRKVSAPNFRIFYSDFDPEAIEREIFPKEKRRELSSILNIKEAKK